MLVRGRPRLYICIARHGLAADDLQPAIAPLQAKRDVSAFGASARRSLFCRGLCKIASS